MQINMNLSNKSYFRTEVVRYGLPGRAFRGMSNPCSMHKYITCLF